jgi:hypothetical protein
MPEEIAFCGSGSYLELILQEENQPLLDRCALDTDLGLGRNYIGTEITNRQNQTPATTKIRNRAS